MSSRARRILVIRNPVAGRRDPALFEDVVARLVAAGQDVSVRDTGAAGDARILASAPGNVDIVVAAGGDGTISEVVDGLMSLDTPPSLAILPLGTANVMAHEIGLRSRSEDVADAIVGARARAFFPGRVSWGGGRSRHFALMVGVGFYAHVVAGVTSGLKRRLGKGAYVWRSAVGMARFRDVRYAVEIDGRAFDAASVIVSKARHYAGPYVVAPGASLSAPGLSVCLFDHGGRWSVARYGLALVTNRLVAASGFRVIDGVRNVRIAAVADAGGRREPFQIDGDAGAGLPIGADVAARRLTVLVPRV